MKKGVENDQSLVFVRIVQGIHERNGAAIVMADKCRLFNG